MRIKYAKKGPNEKAKYMDIFNWFYLGFDIDRMRFNTFAFRQEIFIRTLLKFMEKWIKIFLCYFSNDKNLIYKMVG